MLRVISAIFLAVLLVGVTWSFEKVWGDFQVKTKEVQYLKGKVAQLEEAKSKLLVEKKRLQRWRALWHAIETSKFNPDDYILVPVHIKRQMEWKDFEKLILMVSNGNSVEAGYWFKPKDLRVTRVSVRVGNKETKKAKVIEKLNVNLQGVFLLNK